jgi:glycosyltransferase involved in cell wall biosynthesis
VHAISHSTARDVAALTGRQADVVVHNPLREWSGEPAMPVPMPAGAFVLHVGHNGFYKNRAGVLEIFARMAPAHPALHLVLAGPAPTPQLADRARALGLSARLQWVHDPGSAQLAWLYGHARLLLFPSLYEGFGWPPLEALQHGCPVGCADTGSLPEVVGDAAVVWPPTDIDGFAQQALRVLGDESVARTLVAIGQVRLRSFTLQRLVEGLVPLYERLARA